MDYLFTAEPTWLAFGFGVLVGMALGFVLVELARIYVRLRTERGKLRLSANWKPRTGR